MERSTLSILKKHGGAMLLAALAGVGVSLGARAAELGEASVRSYIGQPLDVDIELVALAPDEQNLRVVLASPDVYKGANIAMNPALQSLSLSIGHGGGRRFLHVTSARPIDAAHLNLFLELIGGGRSAVRATTVWLTAAPAPLVKPAPLPTPTAAPAPAPAPAAAAAPAAAPAPAPA
ncbi:MAG: fimbrial protein FimV, partial [Burkholderiaceae bacterium]|nr:fimbrial protein FimV [Burkholderiaceae bacterium]